MGVQLCYFVFVLIIDAVSGMNLPYTPHANAEPAKSPCTPPPAIPPSQV